MSAGGGEKSCVNESLPQPLPPPPPLPTGASLAAAVALPEPLQLPAHKPSTVRTSGYRPFQAAYLAAIAAETRPFTLNAYGDTPTGATFLTTDLANEHVWLQPPLRNLTDALKHYNACKKTAPATTSACVAIPSWGGQHKALVEGFQHVRTLYKGTPIFDQTAEDAKGRAPYTMHIYYDPPTTHHVVASTAAGTMRKSRFNMHGIGVLC